MTVLWSLELKSERPQRSGARSTECHLLLRSSSDSAHCDLALAVEVRECPLQSGAGCGGTVVPTAIWSVQLRPGSGSAHCDLERALEARRQSQRRWDPFLKSNSRPSPER